MLDSLFYPVSDLGPLVLRLSLAAVVWFHGWPKLNPSGPMSGPAGFARYLKQMGVPLPIVFAWLVALLETIGGGLLILGLGTRLVALGLAIDMLVAIVLVRRPAGASFSSMQGVGWEFEFALMAMALALLFTGAGSIALDRIVGI